MGKLAEKLAAAQKGSTKGASKPPEGKPSASAPAETARKRPDWEAVERDFRTGRYTLRELEAKHGPSYAEISRRSKKQGWSKDLREAIKVATDAAVLREQVTAAQQDTTKTILVAAELNKQVILEHRRDISELRNLTADMVREVQQMGRVDLERIATMLEDPDLKQEQVGQLREELAAASRLPARILAASRLAQTFSRLQQLERRAFGLDDPEAPPPVDELADLSDEELEQRINERIKQSRA